MAIIRRYDEIICEKINKQQLYEFEYKFDKALK